MTTKTKKISYRASTIFFAGVFATTGTLYLVHFPAMIKRCTDLGYPVYLLNIIGAAKILGAIALVVPKFKRLKEWAYAGFTFDFIGAMWSHSYIQGFGQYILILIPLGILFFSYTMFHQLQKNPSTAIV